MIDSTQLLSQQLRVRARLACCEQKKSASFNVDTADDEEAMLRELAQPREQTIVRS